MHGGFVSGNFNEGWEYVKKDLHDAESGQSKFQQSLRNRVPFTSYPKIHNVSEPWISRRDKQEPNSKMDEYVYLNVMNDHPNLILGLKLRTYCSEVYDLCRKDIVYGNGVS